MTSDPIIFAFCISDSYAQHAAVVIASALASNPDEQFCFHILSGNLSTETRTKLASMRQDGRVDIVFHDIDRRRFDAFPTPLEYISQETYYRFIIPTLIPGRVIYSDVDVVIHGPLRELWETPLTDEKPVAAVREISDTSGQEGWSNYKKAIGLAPDTPYFYAGLLVMDCDRLNKEHIPEAFFSDTEHCVKTLDMNTFSATDQVVINRVLRNRMAELSSDYCVTETHLRLRKCNTIIRHYAGYYEKPWCNIAWNWSWGPYWLALLKTPYRSRALGFLLRHLLGIVWSTHTKKGWRRSFLFGIRIRKRKS